MPEYGNGMEALVSVKEENYPEVAVHADLPDATEFAEEIYTVLIGTGLFGINRKRAGLWRSDGEVWYRLGQLEGSGGVVYGTAPSGYHRVYNLYAKKVEGEYRPVLEVETVAEV